MRFTKSDLVPYEGVESLDQANQAAVAWCTEVNGEIHYRGLADNTVGKLIERLLCHDFIVIDDLGFTALDRVAADHLFRFIAAAYEQRSIAITTNVLSAAEFGHERGCSRRLAW